MADASVSRSGSSRVWTGASVLAFLVVLAFNALANLLPLGGRDTGEISALYPVLITPAPYTFSVWSVIYLALGVFVVYQALPAQRTAALDRTRQLFVLSCVFNVGWLLMWHYLQIPLTLLMMFGLLATLVASYRHLRAKRELGSGARRWILRVPFSLYLGWISVATLVNVAVVLYDLGPLQTGDWDLIWALLAVAALTLLTLWILGAGRDVAFGAVAVWALLGVLAANLGVTILMYAAAAGAAILAAGVLWALLGRRRAGLLA